MSSASLLPHSLHSHPSSDSNADQHATREEELRRRLTEAAAVLARLQEEKRHLELAVEQKEIEKEHLNRKLADLTTSTELAEKSREEKAQAALQSALSAWQAAQRGRVQDAAEIVELKSRLETLLEEKEGRESDKEKFRIEIDELRRRIEEIESFIKTDLRGRLAALHLLKDEVTGRQEHLRTSLILAAQLPPREDAEKAELMEKRVATLQDELKVVREDCRCKQRTIDELRKDNEELMADQLHSKGAFRHRVDTAHPIPAQGSPKHHSTPFASPETPDDVEVLAGDTSPQSVIFVLQSQSPRLGTPQGDGSARRSISVEPL